MESTYSKELSALLAKIPDSVQVPPALESSQSPDAMPGMSHTHRRFARRKIAGNMLCQISSPLPEFLRNEEFFKVVSLDISRGGIAFLADRQLYPEEELLLWTVIGKISCRVARCLKHNGACFEVGAEIAKASIRPA